MKFYVDKQTIRPDGIQPSVASDSIDFVTCYFRFGPLWAGMTRVAQFTQGNTTYNQLLDDMDSCILPTELVDGAVAISVFGQIEGDAVRATTTAYTTNIKKSGFIGDGETPIPPTPDLYAQLLELVARGVGIAEDGVQKTGSVGVVDTYTMTFTDGTVYTYEITNGVDGTKINFGNGLLYDTETETLSVNTADDAYEDNTLPITSGAVYREIGNIDVLLGTI